MPTCLRALALIPLSHETSHGAELSLRWLFHQAVAQALKLLPEVLSEASSSSQQPFPHCQLCIRTLPPCEPLEVDPLSLLSLPASPDVVLVWLSPENSVALEPALELLAAHFPQALVGGVGPLVASPEGATEALLRHPSLQWVLRVSPVDGLAKLLRLLADTPLHEVRAQLQGLSSSLRLGWSLKRLLASDAETGHETCTVVHFPNPQDNLGDKPTLELLSPAHLEELATPIPKKSPPAARVFSWLLTPDALLLPSYNSSMEEPERVFSSFQLEQALRELKPKEGRAVEIWPPLSPQHMLLRRALSALAQLAPALPITIHLTRLPDASLIERFRAARISQVVLEHTAHGPDGRSSAAWIERTSLKSLLNLDAHVQLVLRYGRPEDDGEKLLKLVEQALSFPNLRLTLAPLRVLPGDPLRQIPGLKCSSLTGKVLQSPGWSPEQVARLLRLQRAFETYLEVYPLTLRQLARTLELPLLVLLEKLGELPPLPVQERWRPPLKPVLKLGRQLLKPRGDEHLVPVLEQLLEFEGWVQQPSVRPKPVVRLQLDPAEPLDEVIFAREPEVETHTYLYDVVAGQKKSHLEPLPYRVTRVLALRRWGLPTLTTSLHERIFLQLSLVDGHKDLKTLEEELRKADPTYQRENTQEVGMQGLLSRRLVYVRGRKKPLPPPPLKQNILPFRRSVLSFEAHPRRNGGEGTSSDETSTTPQAGLASVREAPPSSLDSSDHKGTPE
ncbi:MAG: hypothetical protein ACKO6N_28295 [Myxococcota bacterium]